LLDKTGTITFGVPSVHKIYARGISEDDLVQITASLEQYSKHPLAKAVLDESKKRSLVTLPVTSVSERPGEGLKGVVGGRQVEVTSRKKFPVEFEECGLECVVLIDGKFAGLFQFLDAPRPDSKPFIDHLHASHGIDRVVLISGDRESEVRRVAELVGIKEVLFSQSPEDKVKRVDQENRKTIFVGDGINDSLALSRATVGVALGKIGDISAEAADCVILDSALYRVDELLHLAGRMRSVILVSVIGGMLLSLVGMGFASFGLITPVQGAVIQEAIDLFAVLNALRMAREPKNLADISANG
jgi:P-type E1-E2 ATPase